jgi:hypothetical protein
MRKIYALSRIMHLRIADYFWQEMKLDRENKFDKYPLIPETAAPGKPSMGYLASLSFSKRLAFTINPTHQLI